MEKVRETQTKGKKENAGRPCELVNSCRIQAERGELVPKELQGALDISFLYTFEVALLPDQEGNVLTNKRRKKGGKLKSLFPEQGELKEGGHLQLKGIPDLQVSQRLLNLVFGFWFLVFLQGKKKGRSVSFFNENGRETRNKELGEAAIPHPSYPLESPS